MRIFLSLTEIYRYDKARQIFYNAYSVIIGKEQKRFSVEYPKLQRYLFILILLFIANEKTLGSDQQASEDAYVIGDVVKIPVLRVENEYYSLDLQLMPNTEPAQLKMIAAAQLTLSDSNPSNASSFVNTTLTIPKLTAANNSYRIELELVTVEPSVILQLSKAELLITPTNSEPSSQSTPVETDPGPTTPPANSEPISQSTPVETDPGPTTPPVREKTNREKATELFEKSIAQNIVQSKCISCHRRGGYAGGTSLIFEGASGTSQNANIAAFEGLLNRRSDGLNYILRKVSGNGHGGGRQLALGSANYINLEEFLTLLSNSSSN